MILSLAVLTTNTTTTQASWEIITGSTPGRVKLMEIGFTLAAATATVIGFGRPAAASITPTSPVNFTTDDPNDVIAAGVVRSALAWGTSPTVPATFIRRMNFPATIGGGVVWTFPEGITIPVSSGLVLWNIGSVSALNAYAVIKI